jgi:diguanylate cyclase (GGDEF)-like protein
MTIQHDILKARLLGLLIIITLLSLAFQAYGPAKVLTLAHDTQYHLEVIDDRTNGGKSVATLKRDGENLILDCEIIASEYPWPYCEISFVLMDNQGIGMDMSNYQQVKLWAKYSEPQAFGIRFQLINFNPAYSNNDDPNTLKYNAIELFDTHQQYPQIIQMHHMQVPTWWLSQGRIAPDYWGPEFNEIRGVQISTGEQATPGNYQLVIGRVEISGKYISDQTLYIGLLCIWTLMAVAFFVDTLLETKKELRTNLQRQQQLEALNQLLNQEHQQLEERLTRDPLTGVLNRDGLAPVFNQNWSADSTQLLSLIFIDIDHFKKINDTYGHNLGDQVLLAFADTLSKNTRAQDLLARWGGEEFVLACPDTSLENACGLAEKLRRCIEENNWPKALCVTASFGVAQLLEGESPTDFIARADKALYVAKAQGRNCVRVSSQPPAVLTAVK